MKIIRGINSIKRLPQKAVVTVGIFDGVHIGHQFILKKVIRRAKKIKGKSVVITFSPHPLKVLNSHRAPALLTSLNHRINLIANMKIDFCLVVNFTKRFRCLSAADFIKNILLDKIGMREIFVGNNFRFGCEERGDIKLLTKMGEKFGFKVNHVNPVKWALSKGAVSVKRKNRIISSTQIRSLIEQGKIRDAARFLGRPVSIVGTVIKGNARGRWIGYPTANIDPAQEALPPSGVYAVKVKLRQRDFFGILNIGTQPTFSRLRKKPIIEVHIFNFKKDIYARELEVNFIKKLRNERKFSDKEQLAGQIEKDCMKAKMLFAV